jgi:hypothetical protein
VVDGKHWASDLLWAFGMVYLTAYVLARAMRLDYPPGGAPGMAVKYKLGEQTGCAGRKTRRAFLPEGPRAKDRPGGIDTEMGDLENKGKRLVRFSPQLPISVFR